MHRILIVDDDPKNLELILDYLADEDCELLYAPNGQRAVEIARQERPDLILMDWEMPVLNGVEAVKRLHKDKTTQQIPIIIATGVMITAKDLEYALDSGAVDFLRKPFNPIEFNARIRANLRIKEQHETITSLLQETVDRKERELASKAMFEHEKNAYIVKLIEQLDKIDLSEATPVTDQVTVIKRQLKSQLSLKKSWDSFIRHFEEVHPGFFVRIAEKFGSLSISEKRMCAFLKIGLDNKEIAILTHVESGSVRRSLNRLKNRLNLNAEDNLRSLIAEL